MTPAHWEALAAVERGERTNQGALTSGNIRSDLRRWGLTEATGPNRQWLLTPAGARLLSERR